MIKMERTREHGPLDAGNGHDDEHDDDNDGREWPEKECGEPHGGVATVT